MAEQSNAPGPSKDTQALCEFLANLQYEHLPEHVVAYTEELFLDWLGSALGSRGLHPIPVFLKEAERSGSLFRPEDSDSDFHPRQPGTASVLCEEGLRSRSAYWAAFMNAASSHLLEQDDLHNASVLHPATVVFPAALAVAQMIGASGKDLIVASVAGYEAGCRIGEYLGRSHYRYFHTTGTAGTLAAAVAAGKLLGIKEAGLIAELLGNAGTMASGLWQFMSEGADSKQLHTAKAASDGVRAAYLTMDGLRGARDILEGRAGMAAGMTARDHTPFSVQAPPVDPQKLSDRLGVRWATTETSYKWHASCRHTHPAADALLSLLPSIENPAQDIVSITAYVYQAAIDVLGPVGINPQTVHQAKFSMPYVLALIALFSKAGLVEFRDHALTNPAVRDMAGKVKMIFDPAVEEAYPSRWVGKVEVMTQDGEIHRAEIRQPKGDPGNGLSRSELESKFLSLLHFAGITDTHAINKVIQFAWNLRNVPGVQM